MKELIQEKEQLKERIGELEIKMDGLVRRVLRVFYAQKFEEDTQARYEQTSACSVLFSNHLHCNCYEDFSIDDRGILTASGMYSGSHGYYEHETIRFPAEWVYMGEDILVTEMQHAWANELKRRKSQVTRSKRDAKAARRAQYEKLKKEFESA